ncbi:MAG TPA: HAMP domain-containing protein, partial [Hydrogenophaga sp.]
MKAWKNGSVVKRLYALLGLVGLIVVGQMVLGYVQEWRSNETLNEIVNTEYKRMREVSAWELMSTGTTVRIVALNRGTDPGLASLFGPEIGPRIEKIDAYLANIKSWAKDPEQVALLAEIEAEGPLIMGALGKMAAFREQGDNQSALAEFETGFMPHVDKYQEGIARFSDLQEKKVIARTLEQQALQQQRFWTGMGVTAAIVLVVAGLMVRLAHHIRDALGRSMRMAESVAGGDLTVRSQSTSEDEFGQLMRAMDAMAESLSNVVGRVRSSTGHLKEASGEIAQGNQDLSERTERQASHLQQTTATMADLTEAVRLTADNAGEA